MQSPARGNCSRRRRAVVSQFDFLERPCLDALLFTGNFPFGVCLDASALSIGLREASLSLRDYLAIRETSTLAAVQACQYGTHQVSRVGAERPSWGSWRALLLWNFRTPGPTVALQPQPADSDEGAPADRDEGAPGSDMMSPPGPMPRWRFDRWHFARAVVNLPFDQVNVL
jgi:hypothetical protein